MDSDLERRSRSVVPEEFKQIDYFYRNFQHLACRHADFLFFILISFSKLKVVPTSVATLETTIDVFAKCFQLTAYNGSQCRVQDIHGA